MPYLILYMLLVVSVNVAFVHVPLIQLPGGEVLSPVALVVGFIFVVRDVAQRHIGHKVLLGMLAGVAISWFLATPELAFASAAAFAVGEFTDWLIYTLTRRPFSQRILFSSLVGVPLDSYVFLSLIGLATPMAVFAMSLSKMAGSLLVFLLLRRREAREADALA